ncbi:MAG: argininosuccinate lyase [Acidimicrobiia bacterium]|nr:argininosuccinate lyase [Acidimicrobiia bacterium]
MIRPPEGYLGAEGPLGSGPSPELVEAGYRLEVADAAILHEGLCLADLSHVLELVAAGVAPRPAAAALCRELLDFLDTDPASFPYDPVYGDAYNSRERELERRLGSEAGWLPTGRTRREAGRIAIRLALRDRLLALHEAVAGCAEVLVERSEELADALWNDTTYLQPAQPSSFGHYLAGFAEQGIRNLDRVRHCYRLVNQSPAGSGGVGGTPIPVDRSRMAVRLGFDQPTAHIRDGMWSGDPMIDCGVAAMQAALAIDRLAEDLEIFASPQFGYVTMGGSSSRASVLLPQKRNPYALAVIRGGCGTLIGRATGLMVTQRTPSARTDNWLHLYGEVVEATEMATRLVRLATEVVASLEVHVARLAAEAGTNFTTATDLADHLVLETGLDYRSSYRLVASAVAEASRAGEEQVSAAHLAAAARAAGAEQAGSDPETSREDTDDVAAMVASRDSIGGSAPRRVLEHCASVSRRVRDSIEWAAASRSIQDVAMKSLLTDAVALAEGQASDRGESRAGSRNRLP